jgi:hypothetical protein
MSRTKCDNHVQAEVAVADKPAGGLSFFPDMEIVCVPFDPYSLLLCQFYYICALILTRHHDPLPRCYW